jgi:hypothetical protein
MTKTPTSFVLCAALCATLGACGGKTAANEKNFGTAVSQFLEKKGEMCLAPVQWPVDVYEADLRQQKLYPDGVAGQMAALEAAGLAQAENVELPDTKVKVRRYTMSEAAKPYLRGDAAQQRLCWGRKSLDKVLSWAEPVKAGDHDEASVIYTYQLSNVAGWARKPQMKTAFPAVGRNVDGERTQKEKLYVRLTPQGWEALGLDK